MDQLKPCPFCGGEVSIALTGHSGIAHWIITRGRKENACRCRVFMESNRFIVDLDGNFDGAKEREELIQRWNTREPIDKIVEQLENASYWTTPTFDEDGYSDEDTEEVIDLDKAIEIVKTGGKE